jgi:protein gp37
MAGVLEMNKTNIEWCDYTWNPVTGCKRGCSYCYAKQIHNRFWQNPFEEIVFHQERLLEPQRLKKPSRIFVGSMSDIEYWTQQQVESVIEVCRNNPQHTFMFLSKRAYSYNGYIFPENCMCGLTVTHADDDHDVEQFYGIAKHTNPFISIEPIMGIFKPFDYPKLNLIILGAMTGRGATPPKPEWIDSVQAAFGKDNIFYKSNIKQYL